jgi:uncharacterized caspase-like protein
MMCAHQASLLRRLLLPALLLGVGAWPSLLSAQTPVGKKLALVVGINKYHDRMLPELPYAVSDATALAATLQKLGFEVVLLTDATGKKEASLQPSKENIEREVQALLKRCQPKKNDLVLMALAGCGVQIGEEPYFCPQEAKPSSQKNDTLVSLHWLYGRMERSFAGAKMLLVDASRDLPEPLSSIDPKKMTLPSGVGVLFSCQPGERAHEHAQLKHGVFFYYVLKALNGEAAAARNTKGEVTLTSLAEYVGAEVPKKAKELGLPRQRPNLLANLIEPLPVLVAKSPTKSGN